MKYIVVSFLTIFLMSSCVAKQAELENQKTGLAQQAFPGGNPVETSSYDAIPTYAINDGANVNSSAANSLVQESLSQYEVVMLQFASTTCGGCQEEAEAVNELISDNGWVGRVQHILVFTDVDDPAELSGFKESALEAFQAKARNSSFKYMKGGVFDGTQKFWNFIVSRDGSKMDTFSHDHSDLAGKRAIINDSIVKRLN